MKRKKRKKTNSAVKGFLLVALSVLFNLTAQAQERTVQGNVTSSEDGTPIPGVAVIVEGTTNGTVTDFDGDYAISVNTGSVLIFQYIGMETQKVTVAQDRHDVVMDPNVEGLDEVVVIGYGTQRKKEVAGAVAQVKAEDIEQFVTPDVASTLQGQVAGLNVVATSGEPGAQSSIQIRGVTTLNGSNQPLFVIDGIPQELGYQLNIPSNEIQTIDVLKDGASAAVYGARGAGGVILITTKRGKEGKMSVSFDHSYGIQRLGSNIPLMNTEQQVYFETQQSTYLLDLGIGGDDSPGPARPEWLNNDNDLRDLVLVDNAENETYNLNVSGGAKGLTYSVSGGFSSTEGILLGSSFKRYNTRASTTYKKDKWKIDTSVGFILDKRRRSSNGLLNTAIRYRPYFPEIDRDAETFFSDSGNGAVETALNQLAVNLKRNDNAKIDRLNFSLSISRELTDDLSFTTRMGNNVTSQIRNIFRPRFELVDIQSGAVEVDPIQSGVSAEASRLNVFSWDGSFNYKKSLGDHNFNVLAATSYEKRNFERFIASRNGVSNNDVEVLDGAVQDQQAISGGRNYNTVLIGFLGRLQYNYKQKYLLSVLARRDGSSKFGRDFIWGTFPSIQGAWNVSDEPFWEGIKETVNNFKIRGGWGNIGNDGFPENAYAYESSIAQERDYIFDPEDGFISTGSAIIAYANQDIKWETSISKGVGIDLGFFRNKLTLTADYYLNEKEDMIFPRRLPGSAGVVDDQSQIIFENIGNMTNEGIELTAQYRPQIGKSKFNINATFTKNVNEITKILPGFDRINNDNSNVLGQPVTVFEVGREAGAFYLHETQGTIKTQAQLEEYRSFNPNAQLGDLIYRDQLTVDTNGDGVADTGDGIIDDNDRIYQGSGLPDFELGFNFRWTYKSFDFAMNWYASIGSKIINATKAESFSRGRHRDLVNMWTPDNPTSNTPFFVDRANRHPNFNGNTDLWLEDGDFARLKLVTFGYTFPSEMLAKNGISSLRIFLSAQNPLTITKYDGYDPEVGGNVAQRGIDNARFPLASLYSVGFNLNF